MPDAATWLRRLSLPICAGSIAFYLLWEIAHRGVYQYATSIYPIDDADEWRYTACSRLVEHGYALFSQVFSAQPPLLLVSLSTGMRLFGDSIDGARWVEIAFGLLGLVCVAWLAWLLGGPVAASAASLVLAVSPGFLVYSHTVEAEGPMMALVVLSLGLAASYARSQVRVLAPLAGLALGAAILMKLFAAEALLPALWLIALDRGEQPGVVADRGMYLIGVAAPLVADFGLLHPRQQWDQVIALHEQAARASLPGVTPPLRLLGQFLSLDLGLTLLAGAGILSLLLLGRWRAAAFLALWVVGNVAMLLLFRPLFPHHLAILLAGLAVSAGAGIAESLEAFSTARSGTVPVIVALAAYVLLVPGLVHDDRHLLITVPQPLVVDLARYVTQHSGPSDFVALDDLQVADRARRFVPPPLCDPSNVRLHAGYLSAQDLIDSTLQFHTRLVVPSFGIYQQVPGYLAWLRQHYRVAPAPDGKTAFFRR